jgi:hypothetical protein
MPSSSDGLGNRPPCNASSRARIAPAAAIESCWPITCSTSAPHKSRGKLACDLAACPRPWSRRALADYLVRALVVAQAEEPRLTQATLGCPLGEANLADQLRTGPVCAARDRARVDER